MGLFSIFIILLLITKHNFQYFYEIKRHHHSSKVNMLSISYKNIESLSRHYILHSDDNKLSTTKPIFCIYPKISTPKSIKCNLNSQVKFHIFFFQIKNYMSNL